MSRINARLDDEHVNKLEQLKSQMQASTTDVLKRAIDELYQAQTVQKNSQIEALLNSDFIACGAAESDLSGNHKRYLKTSMANKYDHS